MRAMFSWLACLITAFFIAAVMPTHDSIAWAQAVNNPPVNNPNNNVAVAAYVYTQPVGGVTINANGLLESAGMDAQGRLAQLRSQLTRKIPAELNKGVPLRSISLRRLNEAIEEAVKAGKPISEEAAFLGGLQQIRYVFVYPEQKDIVLVGPAEGWKMDTRGNIVGATTGRSVMFLDDLVVALRTAAGSDRTGINCSIDPTPEGMQQLRTHVAQLHAIGDRERTAAGIEQALGRQQITVSGVPASSHFAEVLVAADYRMKRLAMKFEPTPIPGMPSFLDMLGGTGYGMSHLMQRWWLEPKYESVLKDPDGLAWEFRGPGVKCMTEEDSLAAGGSREHLGHASPLAQKWADNMTQHYEELAVAEPVFGELRNCMELAMVGALVAREQLATRAGCDLAALMHDSMLKTAELPTPTQVDSKVSMLKKGRNWVISVSGGVMIRPLEIVGKAQVGNAPAAARAKAVPASASTWFWN
ncbi:MAG: DUF1598 domain-containing protein [Thermoguttaceae bacterium]